MFLEDTAGDGVAEVDGESDGWEAEEEESEVFEAGAEQPVRANEPRTTTPRIVLPATKRFDKRDI